MIKVKEEILRNLQQNIGNPVSGQELADRYGVSRNAVWKAVNSLKNEGYPILSDRKKGYCLKESADLISKDSIRSWLPEDLFLTDGPCRLKIFPFREIDSTNLEAQRMIAAGFSGAALIIAEQQTQGRGHNGSSFYSPASSGLYMTLLLPMDLSLTQFRLVSCAAAVAAVESVQKLTGRLLQIREVNDLYDGSRKVGGILCEATSSDLESGKLQQVCIGIGISLSAPACPEISSAAAQGSSVSPQSSSDCPQTSLEDSSASPASVRNICTRSRLAAQITASLMRMDFEHPDTFLRKYRERHCTI